MRLVVAGALGTLALGLGSTTRASNNALNPIQVENGRAGSDAWKPLGSNLTNQKALNGYGEQSLDPGDTLHLRVGTTPSERYRVEIYRLGWYQGLGGRRLACLPACDSDREGLAQPFPAPDPDTGLDEANWQVTDKWTVPANAVGGVYVAHLVLRSGSLAGKSTNIPFVVRSGRRAPILVTASVNTWQAYNDWGGKSLYAFNSTNQQPAMKVSFDRPIAVDRINLEHERPFLSWLERQGYDVEYLTDVDVDADPAELRRHDLVVVDGHSEYWSRAFHDGLVSARDAGVNLAFVGGNQGYWQIRYEDDRQTLVGYKDAWPDPEPDPSLETTRWQDLSAPEPECELIGVGYNGGLYESGHPKPGYKVVPESLGDPWFAGTGITKDFLLKNALGHEWDQVIPGCKSGLTVFFHAGGNRPADMTRYTAPSGARVFATGTLGVVQLLASNTHLQAFMRNAFDDLSGGAAG